MRNCSSLISVSFWCDQVWLAIWWPSAIMRRMRAGQGVEGSLMAPLPRLRPTTKKVALALYSCVLSVTVILPWKGGNVRLACLGGLRCTSRGRRRMLVRYRRRFCNRRWLGRRGRSQTSDARYLRYRDLLGGGLRRRLAHSRSGRLVICSIESLQDYTICMS